MKDRAATTFHTTARQAGQFAKDANIGRLLIGHFSTRYKDLTPVLKEAQEVFENTELAIEGQKFIIS
jgi:ribonuclease Z